MDFILFQNNIVEDISFWNIIVDKFFFPFLIVIFTAYISWGFYRKRQKETIIKKEILDFFIIFNLTMKNRENFLTIWNQHCTPVLKDLNLYLKNIKEMKNLTNCYFDKQSLDLIIRLSNTKQYILERFDQIQPSIDMLTLNIIFNSLIEKDLQDESTTLVMNGAVYFQRIILSFQQDCVQANRAIAKINKEIEKSTTQEYYVQKVLFSPSDSYEDNITSIEKVEQKLLFYQALFSTLNHIIETGLYKGECIFAHLNAFNHHYIDKYAHILKSLNINISKYQTPGSLINIDKLKTIDDNYKKETAIFWEIPLYRHLKRSLEDNLEIPLYTLSWRNVLKKIIKWVPIIKIM